MQQGVDWLKLKVRLLGGVFAYLIIGAHLIWLDADAGVSPLAYYSVRVSSPQFNFFIEFLSPVITKRSFWSNFMFNRFSDHLTSPGCHTIR